MRLARVPTATCRWARCNSKNVRRFLITLLTPVICLFFLFGVLYLYGIRINTSDSLPVGIWRVQRAAFEDLRIGDSVAVDCVAVPQFADQKKKLLLKDVGALPSDVMTRGANVVHRNGAPLPLSTIRNSNSRGEAVDCIEYPVTVPAGHIWLSSRHHLGYDSRYFGPVPARAVIGKAVLLWAW